MASQIITPATYFKSPPSIPWTLQSSFTAMLLNQLRLSFFCYTLSLIYFLLRNYGTLFLNIACFALFILNRLTSYLVVYSWSFFPRATALRPLSLKLCMVANVWFNHYSWLLCPYLFQAIQKLLLSSLANIWISCSHISDAFLCMHAIAYPLSIICAI